MIKFTSKTENYKSPRSDRGFFPSPYVRPTKATVDTELGELTVQFKLQYEVNGTVFTVGEPYEQTFSGTYIPTTIRDENDVPVEIIEFITAGGTYDPERIADWGMPDFERVKNYFDLESIWTGLEFKEQPLKQLAIDWVMNVIKAEGLPLKENFELEIIE